MRRFHPSILPFPANKERRRALTKQRVYGSGGQGGCAKVMAIAIRLEPVRTAPASASIAELLRSNPSTTRIAPVVKTKADTMRIGNLPMPLV